MVHLIVELSKYALIILFSVYTYECFAVFRNISERKQEKKFKQQARILYAIHFTAYLVIFAVTEDLCSITFACPRRSYKCIYFYFLSGADNSSCCGTECVQIMLSEGFKTFG